MIQAASWLFVAVALIGTVLNVRKQRAGFYFWLVSNVGLGVVNVVLRQPAQVVLFAVLSGLAVYGLASWGKI